jgi:hypothetical protein
LDLHLHDLRHTGSTWSAQSGATLKELMARIGHASPRAAMIYQHATRDRDQAIAAALDALINEGAGTGHGRVTGVSGPQEDRARGGHAAVWTIGTDRSTVRVDGA